MSRIVFVIITFVLIETASAQVLYGSVGEQKINSNFLTNVQLLYPDFALTPRKDVFVKNLEKLYILPKVNGDEARKRGLDTIPEIKAEIEFIKQLAEDKYLDFLLKSSKQTVVEVTQEEMKNYYAQHIMEFTPPAQFSFLKATLYDTSAVAIKAVKQKLDTYSKDETQLDEFKMGNKESYVIGFEKNKLVYPTQPEFKSLQGLQVKKTSEVMVESGFKVIYCITSKSDVTPKRFEEVREICRNNVQNQKQTLLNEALRKTALDKYPVFLDSNFFGQ